MYSLILKQNNMICLWSRILHLTSKHFQEKKFVVRCDTMSLSFSLSLSHTHTHIHTQYSLLKIEQWATLWDADDVRGVPHLKGKKWCFWNRAKRFWLRTTAYAQLEIAQDRSLLQNKNGNNGWLVGIYSHSSAF